MENGERNEEMEKYLQEEDLGTPNIGDVKKCKVIQVEKDKIIVDISAKTEGFIKEGYLVKDISEYKPGDVIEAVVTRYKNDEESRLYLSEKKYVSKKVLDALRKGGKGTVVKGRIVRKVRGGYNVEIEGALSAFLPGSQASSLNSLDPSELPKNEYEFEVITFEQRGRGRNNIVVSRDSLLNKEKEEFLNSIEEGQKIKGKVAEITNFGVFIDVGPMTALLPRSEVSWEKSVNLRSKFHVGDEVETVVISKDVQNGKMSLSLKRMVPDPWEKIEEKYPVGSVVKATISGKASFGLFVKLDDGIKGLVHSSEIPFEDRCREYKEGQEIEVEVLNIDTEERKISFSIKKVREKLEDEAWRDIEDRYHVDDVVEAQVVRFLKNGVLLKIEEGLTGFSHISELSWNFVKRPSEVLKICDKVNAKILAIEPESRRIRLSIKRTTPDPWEKLSKEVKVGTPVECEIISVKNSGAIVRVVEYNVEGFLPKSQFVEGVKEGKTFKGKVHKVTYNPEIDERDMVVTLKDGDVKAHEAESPNEKESYLNSKPMTTTIEDMVKEKREEQK
ncbi:S1 RNA-binding domain-containing protein [Mesoaciditoga lauensis]|uniref:S1 RNA-binding domain-containing protein n=1 Tax=Mesoaciditoga lauensis TaxID=1495039 RepID=UPI00056BFF5A|nr:S1 RNA-binding domain-containing protein [Mesoaciditoga lauensis]